MGHARPRRKYLAAKLLRIRQALRLSQPKLAERLNIGIHITTSFQSTRLAKTEPPLCVLLAYFHSGIPLERIIDDDLELFD